MGAKEGRRRDDEGKGLQLHMYIHVHQHLPSPISHLRASSRVGVVVVNGLDLPRRHARRGIRVVILGGDVRLGERRVGEGALLLVGVVTAVLEMDGDTRRIVEVALALLDGGGAIDALAGGEGAALGPAEVDAVGGLLGGLLGGGDLPGELIGFFGADAEDLAGDLEGDGAAEGLGGGLRVGGGLGLGLLADEGPRDVAGLLVVVVVLLREDHRRHVVVARGGVRELHVVDLDVVDVGGDEEEAERVDVRPGVADQPQQDAPADVLRVRVDALGALADV